MKLSELLSALPEAHRPSQIRAATSGDDDPVIRGLAYDSRAVAPGDLFIALRGAVADGHDYLEAAADLGAVACLVDDLASAETLRHITAVVTPDTRRALAPLATHFYGNPALELRLVGITGTNGKTSTSYLVESILSRAGLRTGLIGTVEIRYAGEHQRAVNTTPESLDLQRLLRSMRTLDIEAVAMEVSSHGLELGRVRGCSFQVAAFTNLTQDHLDFHNSMDAYLQSKARLFREHLVSGGAAVVNIDDASGAAVVDAAAERGARVWRCSRDAERPAQDAEVRLLEASVGLDGSRARVALPSGEIEVQLPLIGDFNLENLLVALGIADALGISHDKIADGVSHCPQVPGRMEIVRAESPQAPTVLVDYAHTPDAVDKLLRAVRPLTEGRLIAVFGCGGDRDRSKRPLMAEAVAAQADLAIATSDNPRSEDPQAILRDVEAGLQTLQRVDAGRLNSSHKAFCSALDRREAIQLAISIAGPSDSVVIAGKGHEDYQIVGGEVLPFDDRVEAKRALEARESA